MEIILVHWLIKKDMEQKFIDHWKNQMQIGKPEGFYREILTRPISKPDPKFNTFSITDVNYSTFINIAFWESVDHFDEAIKKFFPKATTSEANNNRTRGI